jgi:hypothetical protein
MNLNHVLKKVGRGRDHLFFDIFGICMLWGIQNQLRFFLRALLGQQVMCNVSAVMNFTATTATAAATTTTASATTTAASARAAAAASAAAASAASAASAAAALAATIIRNFR